MFLAQSWIARLVDRPKLRYCAAKSAIYCCNMAKNSKTAEIWPTWQPNISGTTPAFAIIQVGGLLGFTNAIHWGIQV
ncbi:hypothetical protein R3P38DRAFT_3271383 [Favolaschia claudopus]|uniref:Uncharacterized protein n=1 Tax=Favolaschia claudopus TaxID=2862362 RepID=A0AAW0B688_9AGAR